MDIQKCNAEENKDDQKTAKSATVTKTKHFSYGCPQIATHAPCQVVLHTGSHLGLAGKKEPKEKTSWGALLCCKIQHRGSRA